MIGEKLPFRKAIALEYGENRAIAGLVWCHAHRTCYRFQQLAHHSFDDIIIYALYSVMPSYFDELQGAYSKITKPRWPIWVPPTCDQIPIAKYNSIITIEDTIWSQGKINMIIAASNIINSPIIAASKPNGTTNWFRLLGL